jgi:lysophospholipase L1-like esterase
MTIRVVFVASLAMNVVAMAVAGCAVQKRGGLNYVVSRYISHEAVDPYTALRTTVFEVLQPPRTASIMVGDSITAGGEWAELLGSDVVNRGIGGDTSYGALQRIDSIAKVQPRRLFLMIGTNDAYSLGTSPEQSAENIRSILDRLQVMSPNTKVYLQSCLPSVSPAKNDWIRRFNVLLPQFADGHRVVYLNLYDHFVDGELINPRLTVDGLHLSGEGYVLWATLLRDCCLVTQPTSKACPRCES